MNRVLLILFVSGFSFGPSLCMASCGPAILSYVAGTRKSVLKSTLLYLSFSFTRMIIYVIFCLIAYFINVAAVEKQTLVISRFMLAFGGIFMVLLGIIMITGRLNELKIGRVFSFKPADDYIKTGFFMGLILGSLPCVPLFTIMFYIAIVSESALNALFYSLTFGLGTLLSPLLFLSAGAGFLPKLLRNNKWYPKVISTVCGVIMVFLGVELMWRIF